MKNIITATIIGLASVIAQAQNTYDTNGLATVTLAQGSYTLTRGSNDIAWSLDGVTFDTVWTTNSLAVTNNLYLQGTPDTEVTVQETLIPVETPAPAPPAFFIPVTFTTVPSYGLIKVPAALVDATIVALERQANVQATMQLSSSNVSRIILLNNEDGWWTIKCDPK